MIVACQNVFNVAVDRNAFIFIHPSVRPTLSDQSLSKWQKVSTVICAYLSTFLSFLSIHLFMHTISLLFHLYIHRSIKSLHLHMYLQSFLSTATLKTFWQATIMSALSSIDYVNTQLKLSKCLCAFDNLTNTILGTDRYTSRNIKMHHRWYIRIH